MKHLHTIILGLFAILFISCSEPTMEEDARRAAELSTQSNQYSMEDNMSKAGNAYAEAQEIMNKYKKLDKFDEFYQLYISFLHESSYNLEESSSSSGMMNTSPNP